MLLKHSASAVCSNGSPYFLSCGSCCLSSWPHRRSSRVATRDLPPLPPVSRRPASRRRYATVHDIPDHKKHGAGKEKGADASAKQRHHLHWPTSPNPTPYDVFNLSKGAAYDKARFYDLVKIYHPDRRIHNSDDGIPHHTKLERYRLVIAANHILSDPVKRRQYDLYGAGWNGQADMQNTYRSADRDWRRQPGNPSMNGTWEDWERWHKERNGEKQEPVFMSNAVFAAVLTFSVLVAGWGYATSAGSSGMTLMDMRQQHEAAINRELRRRYAENMELSRRDRVENFVRHRDSWDFSRPAVRGDEARHAPDHGLDQKRPQSYED
ncbi:hypothetical protein VTK73DRAFT_10369 [Phialemonium thermophilum]|uniref:J domain-containing protein n=1 Tax=Phialemonium thermophilum TaxID=223376 RepID=A0ABR3VX98_9PEZI